MWLEKSAQDRLNTNNHDEGSSDIHCLVAIPSLHQQPKQYHESREPGNDASVIIIAPPVLLLRHAKKKQSHPPARLLILQELKRKVTLHSTTQPLCDGDIQLRRREGKRNILRALDKFHKFYSVNMRLESEGYKKAIDFV